MIVYHRFCLLSHIIDFLEASSFTIKKQILTSSTTTLFIGHRFCLLERSFNDFKLLHNWRLICFHDSAVGARSRNRVRITSDDSDDQGPVADGGTAVQRQSTCTVQIDCANFEARFTLPSQRATNGKPDLVRVVATSGIGFAELGHNGAPNVNFFTTELSKLEVLSCSGSGTIGYLFISNFSPHYGQQLFGLS